MEEDRIEASRIIGDLGKSTGKVALETTSIGLLYFLLFIGWICLVCCVIATAGAFVLGIGAIVGAFYQMSSAASFIMIGAGLLGIALGFPIGTFTKYVITKFLNFRTTVKQAKN